MFYITGDTHGDFSRYIEFTTRMQPTDNDAMIILGDAGLNYYGNERDEARKNFVNSFPFTTFCIHGNHEMRPTDISTYKTKEYCGGTVWYEDEYPNILFAKDGEIYNFDGYSCVVIGGAYSVLHEAGCGLKTSNRPKKQNRMLNSNCKIEKTRLILYCHILVL